MLKERGKNEETVRKGEKKKKKRKKKKKKKKKKEKPGECGSPQKLLESQHHIHKHEVQDPVMYCLNYFCYLFCLL